MSVADPIVRAPRVVLLEDQPVVRESLAGLLMAAGLDVVGHFADADAFLEALPALAPDVVVVDLELRYPDGRPPRDGLEVVSTVRSRHPEIRSLVLSAREAPGLSGQVRAAGAVAFLSKHKVGTDALVLEIRAAARLSAGRAPPLLPDPP